MASHLIHLWSCPRNVSTALMYSWAQRPDTQVWDEPLYAHYLRVSGADHPSREEILASMENDGKQVVQELLSKGGSAPVSFFKQMTHHLVDLDEGFLEKAKNVLFIRNSDAIIASYAKVIPHPTMEDIGVQAQYELWQRHEKAGNIQAIVDSQFLLTDPERVLRKLCGALDLPFYPEMLHWAAGPRPEDGIWAKHWYANVHQSTGFLPFKPKHIDLPDHLLPLARKARPYYEFLSQKSIH